MKASEKDEIFIRFISGQNVISVRSEQDFRNFVKLLDDHGVSFILGNKKYRNYDEWKYLAIINNKKRDVMCFEYDSEKGLSWYDNEEVPTEWYGIAPMTIPDDPEISIS